MKGYMYILECSDGTYYTGSTIDLEKRLKEHQSGKGSNYTAKRLPVSLLYYEEFADISLAFYREKQIQAWSRAKKQALMLNNCKELHDLAACKNESHYSNFNKRKA
jgi:putative endonuclease